MQAKQYTLPWRLVALMHPTMVVQTPVTRNPVVHWHCPRAVSVNPEEHEVQDVVDVQAVHPDI